MHTPPGPAVALSRFFPHSPESVLYAVDRRSCVYTFRDLQDGGLMLACQVGEGAHVPANPEVDIHRFVLVPTTASAVSRLRAWALPLRAAICQPRAWVLDVGRTSQAPMGLWAVQDEVDEAALGLPLASGLSLPGPSEMLPVDHAPPAAGFPLAGEATGPALRVPPEAQANMIHLLDRLYRYRDTLGEGSYGLVYEAWDRAHDRLVAVKLLKPAEDEAARAIMEGWFVREAEVLRRLTSDGNRRTPPIHALGRHRGDGHPAYIVMGLVAGCTLREALNRLPEGGRLPLRQIFAVVGQCAEGLRAVHSHNVFHRDIKPGNIQLRSWLPLSRTSLPHAIDLCLIDFGVTRVIGENTWTPDGLPGPGTLRYKPPEQLVAALPEALSSEVLGDIYSLGLVFGEMAFGPTFPDRRAVPANAAAVLPAWALGLLAWMLEPEPDDRPSAEEVVRVLEDNTRSVPSAEHCILARLEADKLEGCSALARAAIHRARPDQADEGLVGRVAHLPEFAAAAGQVLAYLLAWLIRRQYRLAKDKLVKLCAVSLNDVRKAAREQVRSDFEKWKDRFRFHVTEFNTALEPWVAPLLNWQRLFAALEEIREALNLAQDMISQVPASESSNRVRVVQEIGRVEARINSMAHSEALLAEFHREAAADLLTTLRRSEEIRVG